jgi:hypothetical protein
VLFDQLDTLQPGQLLRYEDMGNLLGLNFQDRHDYIAIMAAARKAVDQLRHQRNKVFKIDRGHGLERAAVGQVIALAQRQQARATAAVETGHQMVSTINLKELDPTMANVVRATVMAFERQAAFMRQLDVRQDRLQAAIDIVSATANSAASQAHEAARTAERQQTTIDQLLQRLELLERRSTPPT